MQTELLYQPAYALCRIQLAPGEKVRSESGAMACLDDGVRVKPKATGVNMTSLGLRPGVGRGGGHAIAPRMERRCGLHQAPPLGV